MAQLEVVSDVLLVDIDVSTLSVLEIVEGDSQIGEIIRVMAYADRFRSIDR